MASEYDLSSVDLSTLNTQPSEAFALPEYDPVEHKKDLIQGAAARKKQALQPDRLPDTVEDFLHINPNATPQDVSRYNFDKQIQDSQDRALAEQATTQPEEQGLGTDLLKTVAATALKIPGQLTEIIPDTVGAVANIGTTVKDRELFESIEAKEEAARLFELDDAGLTEEESNFKYGSDSFRDSSIKYDKLKTAQGAGKVSAAFERLEEDIDSVLGRDPSASQAAGEALAPIGEEFLKNAKEGEVLAAAGNLFDGVKETLSNHKQAAAETFIESVPYMTKYLFSKLLAVGMAPDTAEKAVRDFKENNDGKHPTQEEVAYITAASSAIPMLERLGAAATGVSKIGKKVDDVVPTPKTGVSKGIQAGKEIAKGYVGEAATEFGQGILEEFARTADISKVKGGDAFVGAQLGGLSGGAAPTVKAFVELSKATKEAADAITPAKVQSAPETITEDTPDTELTRERKEETPDQLVERYEEINSRLVDLQVRAEAKEDLTDDEVNSAKALGKERDNIIATLQAISDERAKEQTALIDEAKATNNTLPQKQVDKLLTNLRNSIAFDPESIPTADLEYIQEHFGDQIDETTQAVLTAQAKVGKSFEKASSISETADNVINGRAPTSDTDKGFIGLKQYRDAVFGKVIAGKDASTVLSTLTKWANSVGPKAAMFQKAAKGDTKALKEVKTKYGHDLVTPSLAAQVVKESFLIKETLKELNKLAGLPAAKTKAKVDPTVVTPITTEESAPTKVGQVKLTKPGKNKTTKHHAKDQAKADQANKFIGQGKPGTSTARYAKDFGENANTGEYTADDHVFISVNGNVTGRKGFDKKEIDAAIDAGATLYADTEAHGKTPYNKVGEGALYRYLLKKGYNPTEITDSKGNSYVKWTAVKPTISKKETKSTEPSKAKTVSKTKKVGKSKQEPRGIDYKTKREKDIQKVNNNSERSARQKQIANIPNVITAWFNKKLVIDTPLSKLKEDAISIAKDSVFKAREELNNIEIKWGKQHEDAIDALLELRTKLEPRFKKLENQLRKADAGFRYSNLAIDLLDESGELSEEYKDALTMAMHQWLVTSAGDTKYVDESDIKKILNIPDNQVLPADVFALFKDGGKPAHFFAEELGKYFSEYAGLNSKATSSRANQTKLEGTVGAYMYQMLDDMNVLTDGTQITQAVAKKHPLLGENFSAKYKKVKYNPPNKNKPSTPSNPLVRKIQDTEKNSGKLIGNLYKIEHPTKQPTFSPVKRVATVYNNTTQKVSTILRKILGKHQERGYMIKLDTYEQIQTMTREQRASMYGYLAEEEIANQPHHLREGLLAKNAAILDEIDNFESFVEEMKASHNGLFVPFYYKHAVWKNMRMGMEGTVANIQQNKASRHLITSMAAINEFDPVKDTTKVKNFLLAVALGLGVSTDKLTEQDSLEAFNQLVASEEIQNALGAIKAIREGNTSGNLKELNDVILGALNEEGHSYEALVEYEKFINARKNKENKFSTHMSLETDGITNGPSFGSILTGAVSGNIDYIKKRLNRAGYFFKGETSYGEYKKSAESLDMYEEITEGVIKHLDSGAAGDLKILSEVMGNFAITNKETGEVSIEKEGRTFSKEVLVGNVYGQGSKSVLRYAANYGVDKLLKHIYKLENKKEINTFINNLIKEVDTIPAATLTPGQRKYVIGSLAQLKIKGKSLTSTTYHKEGLSTKTETGLGILFTNTYGEGLVNSIETLYGQQKESSAALTNISGAMFSMYKNKLDAAIADKKEELFNADPTTFDPAIDELSPKQYKEVLDSVKQYKTTMPNYFSKKEKSNNKDYELEVSKSATKQQKGAGAFRYEATGSGIAPQYGKALELTDVGVSAVAQSIHQLDAATMALALDEIELTNIHDAILTGVADADEAAHIINQKTLEVFRNMSPLGDMVGNFKKMLALDLSNEDFNNIPVNIYGNMLKEISRKDINNLFANDPKLLKAIDRLDLEKAKGWTMLGEMVVNNNLGKDAVQSYLDNYLNDYVSDVEGATKTLLDDMTYITQYNKEGQGVHLDKGKDVTNKDFTNTDAIADEVVDIIETSIKAIDNPVAFNPQPETEPKFTTLGEQTNADSYTGHLPQEVIERIKELVSKPEELREYVRSLGTAMEEFIVGTLMITDIHAGKIAYFADELQAKRDPDGILKSLTSKDDRQVTGKDNVIAWIKELKLSGRTNLGKVLSKVIVPNLPDDITIQLMDVENYNELRSKMTGFDHNASTNHFGFYSEQDKTAYILDGPLIMDTSVKAVETLSHELKHAIDFAVVEALRTPDSSPRAKQLHNRISNLRVFLERAAKKGNAPININSALQDNHELLAWGLTNKEVMDWMKKQKYTAGKKGFNTFTALVDSVLKFLLPKASVDTEITNAYMELLEVTAELENVRGEFTTPVVPKTQFKKRDGSNRTTLNLPQQQTPISYLDKVVTKMNSVEVFNKLKDSDQRSHSHDNQLLSVLTNLVNPILKPVKVLHQRNNMENLGATLKDKIIVSIKDPKANPPSFGLDTVGFNMSPQEVYVSRLLASTLDAGLQGNSIERTTLAKVYQHVKKHVKPSHFRDSRINPGDPRHADDVNKAQMQWDAIFNTKLSSNGTSDYLREFATLVETNQEFRDIVSSVPNQKVIEGSLISGGIFNTISNIVSAIVHKVASRVVGIDVQGDSAELVSKLVARVNRVEVTNRNNLVGTLNAPLELTASGLEKAGNLINGVVQSGLSAAKKAAIKDGTAEATVDLAKGLLDGRAKYVGEAILAGLNVLGKGKQGFIRQLSNEIRGEVTEEEQSNLSPGANSRFHDMGMRFKHLVDKVGQDLKHAAQAELASHFEELPDTEERISLTKVLLKTDVNTLLRNGLSVASLSHLLRDETAIDAEISKLRKVLHSQSGKGHFTFYDKGVKAMGIAMVTGKNTEPLTYLNAERLASRAGTQTPVDPSAVLIRTIDQLGSLYALKQVSQSDRSSVAKVVEAEMSRGKENGISFMLSLSQIAIDKALERQFANNPMDMHKGYIPQVTNPFKDIQISGTANDQRLLDAGYIFKEKLTKDSADISAGNRYVYVHPYAGKADYMQGIVYINDQRVKGNGSISNHDMMKKQAIFDTEFEPIKGESKDNQIKKMDTTTPANSNLEYAAPVFSSDGSVVSYMYRYSDTFLDTALDRDLDAFSVLPKAVADNHVIPSSQEKNLELLDALHEQYTLDAKNNDLNSYIILSPKSTDKELKEAYNLLPKYMRLAASKKFGSNLGIPIRNDLFDLVVGKRKATVRNLWGKDTKEEKGIKYLISKLLDFVTFNNGQMVFGEAEAFFKEAATFVKDVVINKSVEIFAGNTASNTHYLVARGLSTTDAVRGQVDAFRMAKEYSTNEAEINALDLKIEVGLDKKRIKEWRSRRNELLDANNNSPLKPLIDRGMLPTISEGESAGQDAEYGAVYQSRLSNALGKGRDMVGDSMGKVLDEVSIAHNTDTYKALSTATQLSDFAARYTLIQHTTSRKDNKFTMEQAIVDARRSFVNYDLPTHKALQYAGDHGLAWFLRYPVRMQKVIITSLHENPARVTALLVASALTGGIIPTVYGSLYGISSPMNSFGFIDRLFSGLGLHPLLNLFS